MFGFCEGATDRTAAYDIPTMGGLNVSPRASDRKSIAWEQKTSRYDIANIATPHYHGNDKGVMVVTEKFICNCGYKSFSPESMEEVLFCYNDIMMVHRKVIRGWVNSCSGQSGPSIKYILEKALINFPVLHYPVARKTVDFYNKLQKLSAGYLLPLMPFNLIKLSFNFEGLCPPGLGTLCYAEIRTALMEVLPRLLPTTNTDVQSAIVAAGFESNNGFDLLWRILELAVPGFDPATVPILPLVWHQDSNVLEFHQS
jgi:hypothetical protein